MLLPMNAQDCKDPRKQAALLQDPQYVAELKWNGYRQSILSGEAFSRTISVKTGDRISKSEWLPHIIRDFRVLGDFGWDGELLKYPDGKAKDVTRIMQSSVAEGIRKQEDTGYLTYMLFDLLYTPSMVCMDLAWLERRRMLEALYQKYFEGHPFVKLSSVARGTAAKQGLLESARTAGLEGIMLKNITAPYKPSPMGGDSRPAKTWYKIKFELSATEDCVITGFKPAEQYYKDAFGQVDPTRLTKFWINGWIGGVLISQYVNGELRPVGSFSGIPDSLRAEMSANPLRYLGRVVELRAFEREPTGRFISPVFVGFREDKRPEECVWNGGVGCE